MAKKTEQDIERMKEAMLQAHEKKLEAIDEGAEKAKTAEMAMHQKKLEAIESGTAKAKDAEVAAHAKKMRILDMVAERLAALVAAREAKLDEATLTVSENASKAASTVADKAEAVSQAAEFDERARGVRAKMRGRKQSWLPIVGALGLLVGLGISVGRRYLSEAT